MIDRLVFLILILLSVNPVLFGKTYYISNTGNDKNAGTTIAGRWSTIEKVNSSRFSPGDSILFESGGVWRATLTVPSSGSGSANIFFGSYGKGRLPKILGSDKVTSWANYSGNIWVSSNVFTDPYEGSYDGGVFFEELSGKESWGHYKKASVAEIKQEYDWAWVSGKIYVYSPSNPASRYASVEVSQRDNCVFLNDKNYLVFYSLDLRYSSLAGFKERWPFNTEIGMEIKDCHVSHIGIKGSTVGYGIEAWHSVERIHHNTVHDCGRRGMTARTQDAAAGAALHDVVFDYNTVYDCYHSLISFVSEEPGAVFYNGFIRNNLMYESEAQHIIAPEGYSCGHMGASGLEGGSSDTFRNIMMYNNVIIGPSGYGIGITACENISIYNNIVYGLNANSDNFAGCMFINKKSHNLKIKNNIFYNNFNSKTYNLRACVYLENGLSDIDMDYNLYYCVDPLTVCVNIQGKGGAFLMKEYESFRSNTGYDKHSPVPQNPLFISNTDFHLQKSSAAAGAGYNVGILKDYGGQYYRNPPSIGIFEVLPTGIGETPEETSMLYPNPAGDSFNVVLSESLTGGEVNLQIYNLAGSLIYEDYIEAEQKTKEVRGNFASGTYIVQLRSKKKRTTPLRLVIR